MIYIFVFTTFSTLSIFYFTTFGRDLINAKASDSLSEAKSMLVFIILGVRLILLVAILDLCTFPYLTIKSKVPFANAEEIFVFTTF